MPAQRVKRMVNFLGSCDVIAQQVARTDWFKAELEKWCRIVDLVNGLDRGTPQEAESSSLRKSSWAHSLHSEYFDTAGLSLTQRAVMRDQFPKPVGSVWLGSASLSIPGS